MWRPFDKPIEDVQASDLASLVEGPEEDRIPEGLFVEYKVEWSSKQIPRAVAAFSNQAGGTLMVGVEASGLVPVSVPGIPEDASQVQERVVQLIRSNIAPIPEFTPHTVQMPNGNVVLLVEVPEGRTPPYILMRTGAILERTPTQSEPVPINSRETLDRLFARGERGRRWARDRAVEAVNDVAGLDPPFTGVRFHTIPSVEEGLGANALIYRRSFVARVQNAALYHHAPPLRRNEPALRGVYVEFESPPEYPPTHTVRVYTTGEIVSAWEGGLNLTDAWQAIIQTLAIHADLLEDGLSYPSMVELGIFARAEIQGGEFRRGVAFRSASQPELREKDFGAGIIREMKRVIGMAVYEPEPGQPES